MISLKLAHQTGLALLICSAGGLAVAVAVSGEQSSIEQKSRELGEHSIALRDLNHLKASMSQWFITIDLVFVDGQTYLSQGVVEQGAALAQVLNGLAESPLGQTARARIQAAQASIHEIASAVEASSSLPPDELGDRQNRIIDTADRAAGQLIDRFDEIETSLNAESQAAISALNVQRARFRAHRSAIGAGYLLLVLAVWRWMTLSVVRPVVQLKQAASRKQASAAAFTKKLRGPVEIQQLSCDIQSFVTDLDAARQRAEHERQQAHEAANRVQAVMRTAPDAILTIGPDKQIASFNQAALILFGLNEGSMRQYPADQLIPDYQSALSPVDDDLAQILETTAYRADGNPFPAELSVNPVRLGGAIHHTAVIRDITQRKHDEASLQRLNEQLITASRQAGMAEISSGVLHNVGNVLTSIKVSANSLQDQLRQTKTTGLTKAVAIMNDHAEDLPGFIADDPQGQHLLHYFNHLTDAVQRENTLMVDDVAGLLKHVDHIAEVIQSQQAFAKGRNLIQQTRLPELVHDAMDIALPQTHGGDLVVEQRFADDRPVLVDRHKTLQILINLVKNACDAMANTPHADQPHRLQLGTQRLDDRFTRFTITDTGNGILKEDLEKIFTHGFTTKADGHGFGLHTSCIAAQQFGGSLTAQSQGPGHGATFVLDLPTQHAVDPHESYRAPDDDAPPANVPKSSPALSSSLLRRNAG